MILTSERSTTVWYPDPIVLSPMRSMRTKLLIFMQLSRYMRLHICANLFVLLKID